MWLSESRLSPILQSSRLCEFEVVRMNESKHGVTEHARALAIVESPCHFVELLKGRRSASRSLLPLASP
jgi:hypothetical protein